MGRPPAERASLGRVAVIGAGTPVGVSLRAVLEGCRVPGARVHLFGVSRGEALLGEYDGEARLIQEPDPDAVRGHEVIFVCEGGPATEEALAGCAPDVLIIDLVGALANSDARLCHVDAPRSLPSAGGPVAVAHPLSIALVDLLGPLDDEFGLRQAAAIVLRPAADFGDAGVDELRGQVVSLLNFNEVPKQVFGRQLAFNVLPQVCFEESEPGLGERVAAETGRLLEWPAGRLALQLLTVPVFHGHTLIVRVIPEGAVAPARVAACLSARGRVEVQLDGGPATTIEVSGERRSVVTGIAGDGGDGLWIRALVGEAWVAAAEQAVQLARATGRL